MSGKPEKGFKVEYAKSGRAGCKACKEKIAQDSLRLGKMVPSPHFDGYQPNWFHVKCYFAKKNSRIENGVADIEGFMDIKYEDQKLIKDLMSGGATVSSPPAAKSNSGKAGGGGKQGDLYEIGDYVVEVAKSGRSKCRKCDANIAQGELRCGIVEQMDRPPFLPSPQWHHIDCVDIASTGVTDVTNITGFDGLCAGDQQIMRRKFGGGGGKKAKIEQEDSDDDVSLLSLPLKKEGTSAGNVKAAPNEAAAAQQKKETAAEKAAEKALKAHSDKLHNIRQKLKAISASTMKHILEENDVNASGGDVTLQGRLADIMLHGVPGMCPQCKMGRLSYQDGKYRCHANVDEFSRCQYMSAEEPREKFVMPKGIVGDPQGFLANFKFQKTAIPKALKRELAAVDVVIKEKEQKRKDALEQQEAAVAAARAKEKELEEASDPATCLQGLVFALHSTKQCPLDKDTLKTKINAAGGKLVSSMSKTVTHVIATSAAAANGGAPMKEAHKRGLPVVKEGWLDACIADGRKCSEKDFLLAGEARVEEAGGSKKRKGEEGKTMKIMVKGKGAVDVDSGLADRSHVLEVGNIVYSATLNLTDLASDTNSFYVLQVIQTDMGNQTYLFRKWGRIGTKQGGKKVEQMSKADAIDEFEALFEDKTGNQWEDRTPDRFQKQPGKFAVMELGIASDNAGDPACKAAKTHNPSRLPASVASFMSLITDVDMMKRTMIEMEIDLDKMPLGALSRAQIEKGFNVLSDLSLVLQDTDMGEATKKQKILSCSNRFYTIVPQVFGSHGMSDRHLIDSEEKLLEKRELVETLLEMEIAVSLSKGDGASSDKNPIDAKYDSLKADILPVDKGSSEFKLVEKYLQNTHAKTHSSYTLELVDLFTIKREGEEARYKKFENDANRQLLWHGSRLTNWMGILSQGLRIAPPEAPVTGYMFGKGVYFADMSSKSANYCFATKKNNEGVMLLSEVALGDMHELLHANERLPKGKPADKLSVKGCGKTFPDPAGAETLEDGVVVPCGKSQDNSMKIKGSLLYNEFIVYDTAQVSVSKVCVFRACAHRAVSAHV